MKKILLVVLALALIVGGSVSGTLAYLSDSDQTVNTFSIGDVNISLDETDVDYYGVKDGEARVQNNSFRLIPGHSYVKDPVIHFQSGSEASWLFVKIENGIEALLSGLSIDEQLKANGWTPLDGAAGVYYLAAPANHSAAAVDYPVFEGFTVDGSADVSAAAGKSIAVTAYAIQYEGFASPATAWGELSK